MKQTELSTAVAQTLYKNIGLEDGTKKRRTYLEQLKELKETNPQLIFYWILEQENLAFTKKFLTLMFNSYKELLNKAVITNDLKALLKEISTNKFAAKNILNALEDIVAKENIDTTDIVEDYIRKYRKILDRM